ncbi:MAG: hypothetical protein AAB723_03090 [Patescibacteria group bacterium]
MIDNKEIQKILAKQGDVRGAVFQTDANYILKVGSPSDLLKVDNQLKQWGVGLQLKDAKPMGWYPVAWRVLSLLAIKETFGWGEEEIRKIGENAPKVSVIVKLFFKLFPDIGKFAEQIPKYWAKHYTAGVLEVAKLDKANKELILHLKDFAFHPLFCKYLEGYFQTATKLTRVKESVVTVKEIQCSFRTQTAYEAYQINWTK